MKQYECYFDASYKEGVARIAYLIKHNGTIQHFDSDTVKLKTSAKAESHALYRLLLYINTHFENGYSFLIYGDALNVIRIIACEQENDHVKRHGKKYNKLRILLRKMNSKYDICIKYIPRRENFQADRLSRCVNPNDINAGRCAKKRDAIFLENRELPLDDIDIPLCVKYSKPSVAKYENKLNYFLEHGYLKKDIKIDENNKLLDGFLSYLVLKNSGIEVYTVDVFKIVDVDSVPHLNELKSGA